MSPLPEWGWAIAIAAALALFEYLAGTFWRRRREWRAASWPVSYGQVTKAVIYRGKNEITLTFSYTYPVTDEPYPIPAKSAKDFYASDEAQAWRTRSASKQFRCE
jgi:hypothetical protein